MDVERVRFLGFSVGYGHLQVEFSKDLIWIDCSTFHKDHISLPAHSEIRSSTPILRKWLPEVMTKSENCLVGWNLIISSSERMASMLSMIGTTCFLEVRSKGSQWQDCSTTALYLPFWTNALQQWVWMCRLSCTWKPRNCRSLCLQCRTAAVCSSIMNPW